MRYQYRITKYDPSLRGPDGAFQVDDWTSCSDIGRVFSGRLLCESDYLAVEQAYLSSVEDFLREAHLHALELRGLENRSRCELPNFVRPRNTLTIDKLHPLSATPPQFPRPRPPRPAASSSHPDSRSNSSHSAASTPSARP